MQGKEFVWDSCRLIHFQITKEHLYCRANYIMLFKYLYYLFYKLF